MTALDWFHTIGSIIAIATGAFTIYDRFLRYRPFVSIAVQLEGANPWPYLRVKNVAPYDIFIEDFEVEPPAFGTSTSTHQRSMIETITGKKTSLALAPGQDFLVHIVRFNAEARNIYEDST